MDYKEKIGALEEKYSMYYKRERFDILGDNVNLLVKFNCINNKTISEGQYNNYMFLKNNVEALGTAMGAALKEYAMKFGFSQISQCFVSSVEFSDTENYFLVEVPWDKEQGVAVVFDKDMNIRIVEQDDFL